ncbi:ParB/RepB/Spo0J family partition protein [Aestuariivirga litoralis]|uniref:ParB/RepB/Spo0J family partition protein n=1 Tax=Aestuariivirga litoralis TaxID=2650924 RepID=UPI0018C6B183|nr:ParB/RepB/Spo0J family partition protein [Aestuariivirga litoralis]MBG1232991.1 chromosome partitioning protein ParB [Aestuariivirga litoralis]
MMQDLVPIELEPHELDPGPPPKLDWLPLAKLAIDTDYQREITKHSRLNVKRIAADFSWSKFSPVLVAPVSGGRFAIIDGQHRCTAALTLGYEKVPCCIIKATPEQAAAIFTAVNGNVTAMTTFQLFKAALKAGDEWAHGIDKAAHDAGCHVLRYPVPLLRQKPCSTNAIMLLRQLRDQHGGGLVTHALQCLAAAKDGTSPGVINATRIKAMAHLLISHPGWRTGLAATLQEIGRIDLMGYDMATLGLKLEMKLGDGLSNPDDWAAIKAKVADKLERRLSPPMIATTLRLKYDVVNRAIEELKADA